jgi:Zn-dependent alcohol dehydrogenase
MARMPVITGHEISGIVVKLGADVISFEVGDKVTVDNLEHCGQCHFCHHGKVLLCENFAGYGVHRKFSKVPSTH